VKSTNELANRALAWLASFAVNGLSALVCARPHPVLIYAVSAITSPA